MYMYIIVHCSALDVYICSVLFLSLMSCAYTHFPCSSPKHPSHSRDHRDEEEIYYSSAEESDSEEEEERQDHRNGGEGEEGDSRDEHVSGYRLNGRVTSS